MNHFGSDVSVSNTQGEGARPQTDRGRATRAAVLSSARRLFAEHGYRGAQISDIAGSIGVSVGTVYRYFPSKEQLLVDVVEESLSTAFVATASPWNSKDPLRSVRVTTQRYLEIYRDNADIFRLLIEASPSVPQVGKVWSESRQAFYGRIERMLVRGVSEGVFPSSVRPAISAVLLGGMTEHAAYINFASEMTEPSWDVPALTEQIILVWRGMLVLPDAGSP